MPGPAAPDTADRPGRPDGLERVFAGKHQVSPVSTSSSSSWCRMSPWLTAAGLAQLAAVRRDGVAVASRRHPEPMASVACPITGQRHGTVAALSGVTRSERLEPAAVRPAVVAVARAVSAAREPRICPDDAA